MSIKLSILVPTVPSRIDLFYPNIMKELLKQIKNYNNIELISFFDNKKRTIGVKRQEMLNLAQGEYVVFIDDDDMISGDYIDEIMNCLDNNINTDCVVFDCISKVNGGEGKLCKYGIEFEYGYILDGKEWRGKHAHTMVYKSSIALNHKYLNLQNGEDSDWVKRACLDITHQSRIDKVLYYYNAEYLTTSETANLSDDIIMYNINLKLNKINIDYIMDKINYIDKILWINLDKSTNRRNNMENLLKDINIPNIRINAIDAEKYDNFNNVLNTEFERDLNNYQIAVSLSHIKAISSLKYCDGDYFMICEDDISFDNIKYFPDNHDLKYIIENAPQDFEVLMLYKTCCNDIDELYGDWLYYFNKGIHFYGAACYIISRKGINKMIEMCEYIDDNNFLFNNIKFDFSEFLLYKNLKTYAYKYNYITIVDNYSTIGSELTFHRQSTVFQLELIKNDFKK